jgi:transposase
MSSETRMTMRLVATSMIPRKPGERIKTDRRDSQKLAILHRSGDLTRVWVPDATHEALRDLVRARVDATMHLMRARQQLLAFPRAENSGSAFVAQ